MKSKILLSFFFIFLSTQNSHAGPKSAFFSNGFGGEGGFNYCVNRYDNGKDPKCYSLIELGLRWEKSAFSDPVLNKFTPTSDLRDFFGQQNSVNFKSWTPTKEIISFLEQINKETMAHGVDIKSFALNGGDFSSFKMTTLGFGSEYLKQEPIDLAYIYLVASSSYVLTRPLDIQLNIGYDMKDCFVIGDCDYFFQRLAISNGDETVFFQEEFEKLSTERQSFLMIHEAFIKECQKQQLPGCLVKTLYYDGIVYDLFKGRKVKDESIADLKGIPQDLFKN